MHNNLHSSDISKKYHLRKVRVSLNKFPIFLIHNQKSDYSEKTSIFFLLIEGYLAEWLKVYSGLRLLLTVFY